MASCIQIHYQDLHFFKETRVYEWRPKCQGQGLNIWGVEQCICLSLINYHTAIVKIYITATSLEVMTCAMAAEASELLVVMIRRRDLTASINSFISQPVTVSIGATDSLNQRRVSKIRSVSTDNSWSLVSQSNGSTTRTIELSTSCKQRTHR